MNEIRCFYFGAAMQAFCAGMLGHFNLITLCPGQQITASILWILLIYLTYLGNKNDSECDS